MTTRILLVALGIAWVVALAGLVWMMTLAAMRPHHALLSFTIMDPVLKICVALSVASAAFGMLSGLAGLRARARLGVGGALGWGVVGALLGAAGARNMLINMNPPIPFFRLRPQLCRGAHRPAGRPHRRDPRSLCLLQDVPYQRFHQDDLVTRAQTVPHTAGVVDLGAVGARAVAGADLQHR